MASDKGRRKGFFFKRVSSEAVESRSIRRFFRSGGTPFRIGIGGSIFCFLLLLCIPFFLSLFAGGVVEYDEKKFQEYSDSKYNEIYGDTNCYEDNILIVFLIDEEDYEGFYISARVGSHVSSDVRYIFDRYKSFFETSANQEVNGYYKLSLDYDLSYVMDLCASEAPSYSNYRNNCDCTSSGITRNSKSLVYNYSAIELNSNLLQASLDAFFNKTDVSISFVIDNMENVFGKTILWDGILSVGMFGLIAFIFLGSIIIVSNKKRKRNNEKKEDKKNTDNIFTFDEDDNFNAQRKSYESNPNDDEDDKFSIDEDDYKI